MRQTRQGWWFTRLHCAACHQGWRRDEPNATTGAVLALVAAALSFSLMSVCVKQLHGRLPVAEVVLGRALVSVLLSGWLVRRAGLNPWGQRRALLAWRGVLGTLALFCVYQGLMLLPLASATLLQYLYPSVTTVLAWWCLGERPGGHIGLAMLMGWLGVLVMVHPFAGHNVPGQDAAAHGMAGHGLAGFGLIQAAGANLPIQGVLWAVAGAMLTAAAYVSVRILGRSEHPQVIVLWFPLMSIPLSLPLVLAAPVRPTGWELAWLLGVGLFTQLGQIGLTRGLVELPAARATSIGYAQVVFAALLGWLVFAERLNGPTMAGAGLILASVLLSQRQRGAWRLRSDPNAP